MSIPLILPVFLGLALGVGPVADDTKLKLVECPGAVQTTLKAEAGAAKFEMVSREKDEGGEATYWIDVVLGGKPYSIGVLEDGTLSEITLGVDADEIPFEKLPAPVQTTFRSEGYGQKIETVGKELKYGVSVYEAVVDHRGKKYELVVAEDGTLVEKVLVIDDEELEFSKCPAAVQATLTKHAGANAIQEVTRYTGISKPTYEAEVELKGKVYLIEVAESGYLISKSLEADVEE
jgi:hypothetical protein